MRVYTAAGYYVTSESTSTRIRIETINSSFRESAELASESTSTIIRIETIVNQYVCLTKDSSESTSTRIRIETRFQFRNNKSGQQLLKAHPPE